VSKKKCPNKKKEIYNDKYRHTRDRLFGLRLVVQTETKYIPMLDRSFSRLVTGTSLLTD
jgi:hypothetical protein